MRTEKDQGEQRRYKGENRKMKRKRRERERQREGKNHEDRETRGEDARSKLPPPGSAEHYWSRAPNCLLPALPNITGIVWMKEHMGLYVFVGGFKEKPNATSHFTPYFEKCPYRNVYIYIYTHTYIHNYICVIEVDVVTGCAWSENVKEKKGGAGDSGAPKRSTCALQTAGASGFRRHREHRPPGDS